MSSKLHRVVKSKVSAQFSGYTLLDYLSERFAYNNSLEWQKLIDDKHLKVNEKDVTSSSILKEDDLVEYYHEDHQEPDVDFSFEIIHQNEDFIIVNKPGNLPIHPAGKFFHNTLWSALKKMGIEPHFINRLDRETSGLVLVALNKGTASKLGKQIQSRSIHKEYLAIVEGNFSEAVEARGYLEKDPNSEIAKKLIFRSDDKFEKYGKSGVDSSFEPVENFGDITLIKCIIITGKTHQIRATLNSIGFPLVGDKIYGLDESFYIKFIHKQLSDEDRKRMRMKRQALHAHILKFKDPHSGDILDFSCELPEDMKRVLEKK